MIGVGSVVKVFGKHVCTVDAVSKNGKNVSVDGADYAGWTKIGNVKAVTV